MLVDAVGQLPTVDPLHVRVSIATGLVIVGDLLGAGAAQERAVMGETPNLSARLLTLAEPDAVVTAQSTHRLTSALFEYVNLGAIEAKGFAKLVRAWRVLRFALARPTEPKATIGGGSEWLTAITIS